MKLSRTVTYALQATLRLAESNATTPVPCSKLAAEGGMPERFLLQILRCLVTQGILQSTRGVDGGYSLVRSPEEISVLEIIEAIDGPYGTHAQDHDSIDAASYLRLRLALDQVATMTRQQLQSIKLSQIVRPVPVESV